MSKRDHRSLRDILARTHLQLVLFAVILAASSFTVSGGLVIRSYVQRNLVLVARTVAYAIGPAVQADSPRSGMIDRIVSVVDSHSVHQVEVFDKAGHLLVRWENPKAGLPDWLLRTGNALFGRQPIVVPLVHDGTWGGEVRITGNPEGLLRFALAGALIALSTLVLASIATRILARQLHKGIIDPLAQVAEVAEAARHERTFDRRVVRSGIPEIDSFGDSFNELLDQLQAKHDRDAAMNRDGLEPVSARK